MEKLCARCGEVKNESEYHKSPGKPYGLQSYCKDCIREYQVGWRERNREKIREKDRARWQQRRDDTLKRKYGIGIKEYAEMLERQGRACAICGGTDAGANGWGRYENLHVDHDHETNRVRGLLCFQCNTGLGLFRHDTDLFQRALDYLA